MWFAEYCDYEGLVDVRRALNVTREADRIRNDLTVGPIFNASIIVNSHFAQLALSLVCVVKKLQPRYNVIPETLNRFFRKKSTYDKHTTVRKLENKIAIEKSKASY